MWQRLHHSAPQRPDCDQGHLRRDLFGRHQPHQGRAGPDQLMSRTTAEPFWDLVEESLDEAAFLWKRWEGDLASPVRSLEDVRTWTEDRLEGSLDGVRVAGAELVRLTREGLESEDPARLAVCGH